MVQLFRLLGGGGLIAGQILAIRVKKVPDLIDRRNKPPQDVMTSLSESLKNGKQIKYILIKD